MIYKNVLHISVPLRTIIGHIYYKSLKKHKYIFNKRIPR